MFLINRGISTCNYAFKTVDYTDSIKEPEVYFANTVVAAAMGIDWDITFINKSDESNIYSFIVGRYEIGSNKSPYYPPGGIYPPVNDLRPGEDDLKYDKSALHMLKLSTLVRLSLEKHLKEAFETDQIINLIKSKYSIDDTAAKEKIDEEIKKRVDSYKREFPPFKDDFKNLKDWDVYLSFKDYDGNISYSNAIWRNTVKLNGPETVEFCKQFWE